MEQETKLINAISLFFDRQEDCRRIIRNNQHHIDLPIDILEQLLNMIKDLKTQKLTYKNYNNICTLQSLLIYIYPFCGDTRLLKKIEETTKQFNTFN